MNSRFNPSLRHLLVFDAATCSVMGLALTLGRGPLAELMATPPALLFYAGLSLFPIAAFMLVVAARTALFPAGVPLVVLGNAAWVAASLWLLVSGWIEPNALGHAFIAGQALAVAGLAVMEYTAFRRAPLAAAAA